MRTASIKRKSRETDIRLTLDLDGPAKAAVHTGIGFFDHMLTALAIHSGISLEIDCTGDLEVDCHHTIEDVGIVLGMALKQALGDKSGIARYGSFYIPMDEALGFCAMDISGRPYLAFCCDFASPMIGRMDTQMVEEFFRALAMNMGLTLHLRLIEGSNDHHKAEALFKAFGHALKQAAAPAEGLLSTKGMLD